jgi:hypothetical protein
MPEAEAVLARRWAGLVDPGCAGGTFADEVLAQAGRTLLVLLDTPPPTVSVYCDPGAETEDLAALREKSAAAFRAAVESWDGTLGVLPPTALAIWRRTPFERRRYLIEHRTEALARGIPGDLIDLLVAEAWAGVTDA